MKKIQLFKFNFIALFAMMLFSSSAGAHGVQVGYCLQDNGFLRVYVEHWHGDLSSAASAGTMQISTSIGGAPATVQTLYPTGIFNNRVWNNLPGCEESINIIASCPGEANTNNDWVYFDFAPPAFGVSISIQLLAGNTVVLTEACAGLYPTSPITATFTDAQGPVLTCNDVNTIADPTVCGSIVNYNVIAIDNSDPNPSISYSIPNNSYFPVGTTAVTATGIDNLGNTSTCTFNVTVNDTEAPTIECTGDVTVSNDAGECSAIVYGLKLLGFGDNCPLSVEQAFAQTTYTVTGASNFSGNGYNADGSSFKIGTSVLTYTITDNAGNSNSCSMNVTVNDTEAPTIICRGDVTVSNDPGLCSALLFSDKLKLAGFSDNCPLETSGAWAQTTYTVTGASNFTGSGYDAGVNGATFNSGTSLLTYTITDNAGNTNSCSMNVTVNDTEAPTAVTQNLTVQLDESGNASITVDGTYSVGAPSGTLPTQNDASIATSQTFNAPPGYVAVGYEGYAGCITDNFRLICKELNPDGTLGAATAVTGFSGGGITIPFTTNLTGDNVLVGFNVTDVDFLHAGTRIHLSVQGIGKSLAEIASGNANNLNTTLLPGLAGGGCLSSNPSSSTQYAPDGHVIVGMEVNPNGYSSAVRFNYAPISYVAGLNNGSYDNCGIASISASPTQFTCADLGDNSVTLTVIDNAGNSTSTAATVMVQDNIAPTIECPADITADNDPGVCGAVVDFIVNGTDNCSDPTIVSSPASGSIFPIGVTTVTSVSTDASGNTATCSFSVTVNDTEAPIVDCSDNIIAENDPGICGAIVNFPMPSVTDNCTFPSATIAGFTALGVYDGNTFYISDASYTGPDAFADAIANGGFLASINSATENAFVRNAANSVAGGINILIGFNDAATEGTFVWQNGDPVSYTNWNNGEPNDQGGEDYTQILSTGKWNDVPGTNFTYRYILKLKGTLVQTAGLPSDSAFPEGTTTNTFLATDAAGNTATCSFTVTVNDAQNPDIVSLPANIGIENDEGVCGAVVSWNEPTSDDNCAGSSIEQTAGLDNGAEFPIGTSTVEYTAIDASGNTTVESFTVTVNDTEAPLITCSADIDVDNDPGICGAVINYDVTSSDNCPGQTVQQTAGLSSGSVFPEGPTTNTFVVTDASGNTATCSFTVTVNNTIPEQNASILADVDPIQVNTGFTLSSNFNDDNLISVTWYFSSDGDFTNGDTEEYSQAGTINGGIVSGDFNFDANQTGVYTVKVVVTDACGEQAEAKYNYVVIYDPSGGFVTGGGWIYSPSGALVGSPAEGKANFGFVAKYKTGKNNVLTLDGNTNFQFKEGDFHFKSNVYDEMSLVISGGKKATYRGTGTVNGSGSHKFLVTVIDGDATGGDGFDKFRIKIWASESSSEVIYDNEFNVVENAESTTVLGGGSIVIHKPKANTKSAEIATTIEPEVGFSELKAYPNPFSDKLFFEFSREDDSNATLILYDGVGREVSVLFDQPVQANQNYRVEFVPNGLSTNMLFYRMTFDNEVINGKVIYKK